jgi:nucleoside-diphosphate-sugar epimerase
MSSVGVYGDCEEMKTEESKLNPKTAYEKSKAQAEHIVNEYQELITVNILRPAIILGQNEYWEKIVKLIKKDFPLIGNGENKWQMVYVNDLVNALVFVIEHKKAAGEVLNIAEENPLTLKEIVLEVRKATGMDENQKTVPTFIGRLLAYFYLILGKIMRKSSIVSPEHLDRLTRGRWYSIEKIKALGWKPSYDTKEAIARTVFEILEKEKKYLKNK